MFKTIFKLLTVNLNLFDGEGGGASAGASTGGAEGMGDSNNASLVARGKSKGEYANVLFGKQAEDNNANNESDADSKPSEVQVTSNTLEERKKAFHDLISNEYKDLYTEETQNMINRRFKETKNLEKQLNEQKALMDMLSQRYKVSGVNDLMKALENDDAYWEEGADEAGMTVEQYKKFQKLERENKELLERQRLIAQEEQVQRQMLEWNNQAEALKQTFPNFDLSTELANNDFQNLLLKGVPVDHAYKLIHMDEINSEIMKSTAQMTEKRVVDNIRSKGNRPVENGASSQSAFVVKNDVRKLSRADRAEIARRASRGEMISF